MSRAFILPEAGWTYCPRCNANNMVATEPGQLYECPMCGVGLRVIGAAGEPVGLEATQPLHLEEVMRYQMYMAKLLNDMKAAGRSAVGAEGPLIPPRRVRMCWHILNLIARLFSCRVTTITDKTVDKGGKREQR